jgi:adenylate kinase
MAVIPIERTAPAVDSPRLVMVGPQGAGKGTQGVRIATAFGVPIISTGDLFREHVAHRTHLGAQVQKFLDAGRLVPDELTGVMVRQRLSERSDGSGFLLDGYPRNVSQAAELDRALDEKGECVDAVIALDVARAESISRLRLRAGQLHRTDDTEAVIIKRLDIYEAETVPLLEAYAERGILDTVDGVGVADDITERIFAALAARHLIPAQFRYVG